MSEAYRPGLMPPRKTYSLHEAALHGDLVFCTCNLCRRKVVFLAADLVHVLSPMQDALVPPFPCSKCKTKEYIRVKVRVPYPEDYGTLEVRRLREIRPVAFWGSAVLD